jgi:signal transduction histidine kinase/CheY-like chemotaxis protein
MHAEISAAVGLLTETHEPSQTADLRDLPSTPVNDVILRAGFRARLLVPLLRSGEVVGALVVRRKTPGEFANNTIALLQTFAAQSVLAIQNARLFREIEEKSHQLAEASQHKSQFVATMSHEIRTPMNGVLGLLELLQKTSLNAEQRELTDVVRESASSLLKIIDDILDFSKIEAGRIEIERVPLSPLTLVEGVADALAPHIHKKKLLLATFVDASVPPMVEGDPVRLRQILFNLIGNAIKFTEHGEITVRMSVDSAAPGGGMMLQVQIRDTGIGLTPGARARLFQPFIQADGSTTRRFGGTGLGLSICRRLVERMGGEIGVESEPGKGSTFRFTMSVAPSTAPAPVEPDLAGLCVVAIVDNPSVYDMLKSYLSMAGARVEISWSADAALALLRRYAAASTVVDAVIFALQGPVTDAIAFRRAVAAEQGPGATPCLLLSAYDEPAQRGQALDAGFAAYLLMPIRRATLLRALAEARGRSPGLAEVSGSDAATTTAAPPDRDAALAAGQLILVAEDNATNQLVIARQLAQLGYAADLTDNGRMALERFRAGGYGLVLTDIHMPEMNGIELTTAIRDLERTQGRARVPILALTADALVSEAERCLAAGIDDRIRKPVSLAQLEEAMARWLPKAAPPPQAATAQSSSIPGKVAATQAKILNLEQMRENFGAIDGTIVTLLQRYVESTQSLLVEIDRALAARSAKDVRGAAHSALGASRTAGAEELAAILTDLETAMETKAWDHASALREQLVPAFMRVKEAVNRIGT